MTYVKVISRQRAVEVWDGADKRNTRKAVTVALRAFKRKGTSRIRHLHFDESYVHGCPSTAKPIGRRSRLAGFGSAISERVS